MKSNASRGRRGIGEPMTVRKTKTRRNACGRPRVRTSGSTRHTYWLTAEQAEVVAAIVAKLRSAKGR